MVASLPPARMASASPILIMRQASPMLWFEVAQAVTMHMFGPRRPHSMEIMPLAMLAIIIGMVKGETRDGLFLMSAECWVSRVSSPPMPLPTMTPTRVVSILSISMPESAAAILAAAMASWVKRSARRESLWLLNHGAGSKSTTSPPILQS
jgi:hypothetical protein